MQENEITNKKLSQDLKIAYSTMCMITGKHRYSAK